MHRFVTEFGKEVSASVVGAIMFSITYMVFHDYIMPPPRLSGLWRFSVEYKDTSVQRYKDMSVTYQTLIVQNDLQLTGTGEKVSAVGPNIPREEYMGKDRVPLELTGTIKRKYFSADELVIHYKEAGAIRQSSTLHELKYFNPEAMCGCFKSTIADTSGIVSWRRVDNKANRNDPVEHVDMCNKDSC